MTCTMSDQDRVQLALQNLRDRGYWARAAHEGGWNAVPKRARANGRVVFWEAWRKPFAFGHNRRLIGALPLLYVGDAEEVGAALEAQGFEWSTSDRGTVMVEGRSR